MALVHGLRIAVLVPRGERPGEGVVHWIGEVNREVDPQAGGQVEPVRYQELVLGVDAQLTHVDVLAFEQARADHRPKILLGRITWIGSREKLIQRGEGAAEWERLG